MFICNRITALTSSGPPTKHISKHSSGDYSLAEGHLTRRMFGQLQLKNRQAKLQRPSAIRSYSKNKSAAGHSEDKLVLALDPFGMNLQNVLREVEFRSCLDNTRTRQNCRHPSPC